MLGQLVRRGSRYPRCVYAVHTRTIKVDSSTKLGFPCAYTDEETRKILNTLNEQDVEELYK